MTVTLEVLDDAVTVTPSTDEVTVETTVQDVTVTIDADVVVEVTDTPVTVETASPTTLVEVSGSTTVLEVGLMADTSIPAEQVHLYVKNGSGSTLTKGQAVYITGASGTNILIGLAQANGDPTSSKTLGILEQDLAPNAFGYVCEFGILTGLNTAAATEGDPIWLSPTTAGGLLFGNAAKPSGPNHLVSLGVVTRSNANNGEIFVKVQNGYEIEELHDVAISGVTDGDLLRYDAASSLWQNSPGGVPTFIQTSAPTGVTKYVWWDTSDADSLTLWIEDGAA